MASYYCQFSYQIMTVLRFTISRNSKSLIAVYIMTNQAFFFATRVYNYILYKDLEVFRNKLIRNCKGFRLITWLYLIHNLRYAYKISRAMKNIHWKVSSVYWRTVEYDVLFFALILARTNMWVKKHSAVHESWWVKAWSRTLCTVSMILKLKRVVCDHSLVMLFISPGSPGSFEVSESLHLQVQGIWVLIGLNVRSNIAGPT